ncbi:mitogen-activated protein kinase kinase kinase NPK1-like isoform X2 [Malania oleifera]|uniref:mitogen-activated protein kinase kinase kinase NPK1-like isoform X2 n=1 Tax=Malania oleifera TaxID=397392 RepID=UPI0025AE177C|nr:mitogen-activated protein kinase kinase kinase NPK1-like isoform X2 [Malania oleifera]
MEDIFGSVRRSLVFRTPDGGGDDDGATVGTLVDKIGSCIRNSRVFSRPSPPRPVLPPVTKDVAPLIRWRKGELIGCGAFGRVYMGMNLDSGELLAVKQVLIATSNVSREKAQAHIRELEEEVKLLKNLSHPNIVRYLGTVREEETLNILLEFVPGGSISSLLGKFGSFPEAVIRMYTKQLLLGLEYLHENGIMHRDIKGANILVDNKGCIKLADFGASKQATISGAKSMKGTPYWMAPEVILQTGHNFSADIWSVGCTVIEMATGKPPWSQQYQEVAALFHIGTTKSHPPIPEHLSAEAKHFLQKCLQKEPNLRPAASELLQHPFVVGENMEHFVSHTPDMEISEIPSQTLGANINSQMTMHANLADISELRSLGCSTLFPEKYSKFDPICEADNSNDDMCQIDDKDDFTVAEEVKFYSTSSSADFNKSFNPMCDPSDDWRCKFDGNMEPGQRGANLHAAEPIDRPPGSSGASGEGENDFSSGYEPSLSEDDDEVTESKIKALLDEKALELKKLQTPLYEEFYNTLNGVCSPSIANMHDEHGPNYLKLPCKSRSPNQVPAGAPSAAIDAAGAGSPGSDTRCLMNASNAINQTSLEIVSPQINDWKEVIVDGQQETSSPSASFSERQRKWKEELDQELERKREMMRQAGIAGKTSSPKDPGLIRHRERSRFASPGK